MSLTWHWTRLLKHILLLVLLGGEILLAFTVGFEMMLSMMLPGTACSRLIGGPPRFVQLLRIAHFTTFTAAAAEQNEASNSAPCINYVTLSDEQLLAQCKMDTYRASGPGGQHRNKTESAVRLRHLPTGLVSQACEDRSQHRNREYALQRLRHLMAIKLRNVVELEDYEVPPELSRILPRKENKKLSQRLGPNHPDYVLGMQLLLDLITSVGGSVSDAGKKLGLSTGALSKLIVSDNSLLLAVNELRASRGLKPLK